MPSPLLDIVDPLFQYMCRLNRTGRIGGPVDPQTVRDDVKGMLEAMKVRAAAVGGTATSQFDRLELPLIFFVDYMIKESRLPFARQWKEIAFERNELAGDEKFFDLLEETLRDPSDAASERLEVYYHCLGLGFTGWYTGQPEYLRRKMREIHGRIKGRLGESDPARLCDDAYRNVDTRDLIEPPGTKIGAIVLAMVALIVVLLFVNGFLYYRSAQQLTDALDRIVKTGDAPATPSVPAPRAGPGAAPRIGTTPPTTSPSGPTEAIR